MAKRKLPGCEDAGIAFYEWASSLQAAADDDPKESCKGILGLEKAARAILQEFNCSDIKVNFLDEYDDILKECRKTGVWP